jgi:hypothetical protein
MRTGIAISMLVSSAYTFSRWTWPILNNITAKYNVRHCTGGDAEHSHDCEFVDREYEIGVRIGVLFAVLAASSIGKYLP